MSLTKVSYSLIQGAPENVLDYGADPTGIADSSAAIQAALDTGNAVYIPPGTYLCNVTATKGTFIQGAGNTITILKPFSTSSAVLNINNFPQPSYYYEFVSDISFEGPVFGSAINQVLTGTGIQLTNPSVGRIVFTRLSFTGFFRGFYKVEGNLGNTFYDCNWQGNSYGYYVPNSGMQPGNDRFEGGNFANNTFCGVYVVSDADGVGGFVFNETIFQQNYGYGVFMDVFDALGDVRYPAIIFNNTYEESNGKFRNGWPGETVTLDTLLGPLTADPIPYRVDKTGRVIYIGCYGAQIGLGTVPTIQITATPVITTRNITVLEQQYYGEGANLSGLAGDQLGNLIMNRGASGAFIPNIDNTINFGSAAKRWATIFAGTGAINTSDEREKQDIKDLSAAEKQVAIAIKGLIKSFKFKNAVTEKGTSARIHVGVMAQQVAEAFKTAGLNPDNYGMFCYDEWEATEKTPAGNRYGIRYDELLAFVIAAM
tara:strand:+ start:524 stop:1975 length:1452 start_codon:yes stop_codon:yes gene_type:complete